MGSAESRGLCRHRHPSSRARDRLPCPQEHRGRHRSKEELANEKEEARLGLRKSLLGFSLEKLHFPTQPVSPQKHPGKRQSCPQHHLHSFPSPCPKRGGGARSPGVATAKSRTGNRVWWLFFPHQWPVWGKLMAFTCSGNGEATLPKPWGVPCPCPHHQLPPTAQCPPARPRPWLFALCSLLGQALAQAAQGSG